MTVDDFYAALLEDDPEELYDNAPCAYLSTLPDGTIAKVNATFLRWTGFRRDDVLGRRLQELFAPGDRIFYETHFAPLLVMQGFVREIAVDVTCRDGDRLPVLANAVVKRDGAGEPVFVRTVLFDATERRRYEQELLDARRRAEESEARATALARTLQQSFLPPELRAVPGVDVAGAYRPAGDGTEVGGDFYDVFEVGPRQWGVVLGDVCGKGAAAATLTALARYTVRADASDGAPPSEVLGRLHAAFVRFDPERFCTAIYGVLRRDDGGRTTFVVGSGGHHLPLLARADGSLTTVGVPGTMIGVLDTSSITDVAVDLAPGDTVVLYTDGVTEARRGSEFFGSDGLTDVIAAHSGSAAAVLADAIVGAALDFQAGDAADDIAVLVLKVR